MTPELASNTGVARASDEARHGFAKDQLKSIVARIEKLESEKQEIADLVKDVYSEAKSGGFDCKAIRTIVRMRKQDADERSEQETILELYMSAMGML